MEDSWNLSEKMFVPAHTEINPIIWAKDVKEFINEIKPNFCPECGKKFGECNCEVPVFSFNWIINKINDKAGEKLR